MLVRFVHINGAEEIITLDNVSSQEMLTATIIRYGDKWFVYKHQTVFVTVPTFTQVNAPIEIEA